MTAEEIFIMITIICAIIIVICCCIAAVLILSIVLWCTIIYGCSNTLCGLMTIGCCKSFEEVNNDRTIDGVIVTLSSSEYESSEE